MTFTTNSKLALLAAVCSLSVLPSTVNAQLAGADIAWQYYAYGGAYTYNFGGGTSSGSFLVGPGVLGNFDSYFDIEADNASITFDYSEDPYTSTWATSPLSLAPDIYNGIDLDVLSGPTLTSVSIDPSTNMAGFNLSDIYFSGNEIQVNWANLPFDSGTIVKLDVNSAASGVPAPPSCLVAVAGLAMGAVRRRLNKAS